MKTYTDIESMAAALHDGGWRSTDRDQLVAEYDLTAEEADALCAALRACGEYYFPDDEYVDEVFGAQDPICIDEQELDRLCREWGEEVRDQVHEATPEELERYGHYDTKKEEATVKTYAVVTDQFQIPNPRVRSWGWQTSGEVIDLYHSIPDHDQRDLCICSTPEEARKALLKVSAYTGEQSGTGGHDLLVGTIGYIEERILDADGEILPEGDIVAYAVAPYTPMTDDAAYELHDKGWKAADREALIERYDLSESDADEICEMLEELEEESK